MGKDRVCVGAIAGSFGVRGEVRLKSFCADPEAIGTYSPIETEEGKPVALRLTRAIKAGFAAKIDGVGTKEAADAMRGVRLYVDRARLPEPDEDEFYHSDLIGMDVVDTGGAVLGKVKAVLDHGAGDLLELHIPGGGKSALLPFTKDIVPTVDMTERRLVVDPPEGLLD